MKTEAITLMEAYIIENLRKQGVSNDELIAVNDEAIEQWKTVNESYDYTLLEELSKQNRESFSAVINNGYKVKFLTLNGLVNLIQLKLDKTKEVDFKVHDDGISELEVSEEQRNVIEQMISANWRIEENEQGLSVRSNA